MADSEAFRRVCEDLERETSLSQLEARGTVRIALKQAGLDAQSVDGKQMVVVLQKILPGELDARGVAEAARVCSGIASRVSSIAAAGGRDSAEAVFQRLGG